MKKNILISFIAVLAICLTAFGFMYKGNPIADKENTNDRKTVVFENGFLPNFKIPGAIDFVYNIDKRFNSTITKEKLDEARTIADILPPKFTESVASFQNSRVAILLENSEKMELGDSEVLNEAQLKLLKSTDYSSDIRVTSVCQKSNGNRDATYADSIVLYLSIVPNIEAEYEGGFNELIKFLRTKSIEKTHKLDQKKIQPGKISFVVAKNGELQNVKLISTVGDSSIDEEMLELIANLPGKWIPASDAKGEKVDQELVFFYGTQGC